MTSTLAPNVAFVVFQRMSSRSCDVVILCLWWPLLEASPNWLTSEHHTLPTGMWFHHILFTLPKLPLSREIHNLKDSEGTHIEKPMVPFRLLQRVASAFLCIFWGNPALWLVRITGSSCFFTFAQYVTHLSGTKKSQKKLEKFWYQSYMWQIARPYYRQKTSLFS